MSDVGKHSAARQNWKKIGLIARRAGGDEDSESTNSGDDDEEANEQEREARRKRRLEEKKERQKAAKMMDLQVCICTPRSNHSSILSNSGHSHEFCSGYIVQRTSFVLAGAIAPLFWAILSSALDASSGAQVWSWNITNSYNFNISLTLNDC